MSGEAKHYYATKETSMDWFVDPVHRWTDTGSRSSAVVPVGNVKTIYDCAISCVWSILNRY